MVIDLHGSDTVIAVHHAHKSEPDERDAARTAPDTPNGVPALHVPQHTSHGLAELRLLAVSHHTAAMGDFERAALGPEEVAALYARLEPRGFDAVLLATCNRVELYWRSLGHALDAEAEQAFREATGASVEPGVLLRASGEQAAHHLFRVACGLDSLVIGEAEIMTQVREAVDQCGSEDFIAGVFRAALRCGGCARAETGIGAGALSVASAGAQLVAAEGPPLSERCVVVVGAGETGVKVARHLRAEEAGRLVIANRTLERARAAAAALDAEAAPLEAVPALLREADAVIVAAHAPAFLIAAATVREAVPARSGRPLVMVDISMPRAIDPAARGVPGVTLHDMLGLEAVVRENRARREREIPRVEAVIQRELDQLRAWAHQRLLRPLMADLRQRAEAIRVAELRRSAREDLRDPEAIERLTRRLVDRLVAIPVAAMREAAPDTLEVCGLRCLRQYYSEPPRENG
jgi:glutamyl-tRNA reductase